MTVAYNLLTNWKQDPGSMSNVTSGDGAAGVAFTNVGASDDDNDQGGRTVMMLATQGNQGAAQSRQGAHQT